MKKVLLAGLLTMFSASIACAADASKKVDFSDPATNPYMAKTIIGGIAGSAAADKKDIGKLSTNVALGFSVNTQGYALITQHLNGAKAFGTAHDGTAIYAIAVTKGEGVAEPASANVSAVSGNGWTAQ